jgi:hypothetical protein
MAIVFPALPSATRDRGSPQRVVNSASLPLDRLRDDCAPARLALGERLGEVLCLLEEDVRRQRRHFRIRDDFEHRGPAGGERLVPARADVLRPSTRTPCRPTSRAYSA